MQDKNVNRWKKDEKKKRWKRWRKKKSPLLKALDEANKTNFLGRSEPTFIKSKIPIIGFCCKLAAIIVTMAIIGLWNPQKD